MEWKNITLTNASLNIRKWHCIVCCYSLLLSLFVSTHVCALHVAIFFPFSRLAGWLFALLLPFSECCTHAFGDLIWDFSLRTVFSLFPLIEPTFARIVIQVHINIFKCLSAFNIKACKSEFVCSNIVYESVISNYTRKRTTKWPINTQMFFLRLHNTHKRTPPTNIQKKKKKLKKVSATLPNHRKTFGSTQDVRSRGDEIKMRHTLLQTRRA